MSAPIAAATTPGSGSTPSAPSTLELRSVLDTSSRMAERFSLLAEEAKRRGEHDLAVSYHPFVTFWSAAARDLARRIDSANAE